MTALRHPHSNPDAPTPSGNDQFRGFGAVSGPGITRSCDRCGRHRVQALGTYVVRPRQPGQAKARPLWYCAGCALARLRKLAEKEQK